MARGPYVVSQDAVTLVGDSVSFDWYGMQAVMYDVYGYLLNEDTGATINLLNQTSNTSSTSTEQEGLELPDGFLTATVNIVRLHLYLLRVRSTAQVVCIPMVYGLKY